jgi:hypothetical protein
MGNDAAWRGKKKSSRSQKIIARKAQTDPNGRKVRIQLIMPRRLLSISWSSRVQCRTSCDIMSPRRRRPLNQPRVAFLIIALNCVLPPSKAFSYVKLNPPTLNFSIQLHFYRRLTLIRNRKPRTAPR